MFEGIEGSDGKVNVGAVPRARPGAVAFNAGIVGGFAGVNDKAEGVPIDGDAGAFVGIDGVLYGAMVRVGAVGKDVSAAPPANALMADSAKPYALDAYPVMRLMIPGVKTPELSAIHPPYLSPRIP